MAPSPWWHHRESRLELSRQFRSFSLFPLPPRGVMAFQQQHRRPRLHQQHSTAQEEYDDLLPSTESVATDSTVLLFGGTAARPPSPTYSVSSDSVVSQSWTTVLPPPPRPSSPISSSSASSTSQQQQVLASPASLTHSLFPSHDGNGIFLSSDSLVPSDPSNLGADDQLSYFDGQTATSLSDSSSLPYSSSDYTPSSESNGGAQRPTTWQHRRRNTSRDSNAGLAASSTASLGSSWALTEEALSSLPRRGTVRPALAPRADSVGFTSDSASDEDGDDDEDARAARADEDALSRTPGAASAGIRSLSTTGSMTASSHASKLRRASRKNVFVELERDEGGELEWGGGGYSSPPPEDGTRLRTRTKRRHRQAGRTGGSQKRSSTSGSINGSSLVVGQARSGQRAHSPSTRTAGQGVFLGDVASKLMDVDGSTLHLISSIPTPEATPTPSRAASPTRHHRSRSFSRQGSTVAASHGFAALAMHARAELGDSMPLVIDDEEEEDAGEETETERDMVSSSSPSSIATTTTTTTTWHYSTTPLTLAPRPTSKPKSTSPTRSFSSNSLPSLSSSALLPLTPHNLRRHLDNSLLRRTASSCASSSDRGGIGGGNSTTGVSEENPWGGEFDGLEAALSYWRRLLRRIGGY